ncbi:hypothetical protein D6C91_07215 [Aureobasidium pullulans]|uniref:Bromo domain-containing protein n=1 Tax=Aureobasidium pullulans TaxID=5580 RepID=A0A4S9STY9_AURPU|nr:hypothetical protein D6C91_07215 [Aureobasidium pullulans]
MDGQKRAREDALTVESAASKSDAKRVKTDPSVSVVIHKSSTTARPKRTLSLTAPSDSSSEPTRREMEASLKFCEHILEELRKSKYDRWSAPFRIPVDPVALNLPNYCAVIRQPMDISTITKRLREGQYATVLEFKHDMDLMFHNCFKFNPHDNVVYQMGKDFQSAFASLWSKKDAWINHYNDLESNTTSIATLIKQVEKNLFATHGEPKKSNVVCLKVAQKDKLQEILKRPPGKQTNERSAISANHLLEVPAPATSEPFRSLKPAVKQVAKNSLSPESFEVRIARLEKIKADAEAADKKTRAKAEAKLAANKKIIEDAEAEIAVSKKRKTLEEENTVLELERGELSRKLSEKRAERDDAGKELEKIKKKVSTLDQEIESMRTRDVEANNEQNSIRAKIKKI